MFYPSISWLSLFLVMFSSALVRREEVVLLLDFRLHAPSFYLCFGGRSAVSGRICRFYLC